MTAFLVPEGVSMTARDVLTFKCLGSDYQHKKHFFKRRNKHADTLLITKLTGFCYKNRVAKKKMWSALTRVEGIFGFSFSITAYHFPIYF